MAAPLDFLIGKNLSVNYFDSEMWIDGTCLRWIDLGDGAQFLSLELQNGSEFLIDFQHVIAVEVRPSTDRAALSSVKK